MSASITSDFVSPNAPWSRSGPLAVARDGMVAERTFQVAGLITNPRSRRNRGRRLEVPTDSRVHHAAPADLPELRAALRRFADIGIDLLVIDGGDGTIRDVLTAGAHVWTGRWPKISIIPSGKTNALALDLGVPRRWTTADALRVGGGGQAVVRCPIEVTGDRGGDGPLRGFFFGAGAFVEATELAQSAHRAGAFEGFAVGVALLWSMLRTVFSGRSVWSAGSEMSVEFASGGASTSARTSGRLYVLVVSTFRRMPLGLRPFGAPRDGMKTLIIEAPPKRFLSSALMLLAGSEAGALAERGYHRVDATALDVTLPSGFILDGERFPPGRHCLRTGPEIRFVVPLAAV